MVGQAPANSFAVLGSAPVGDAYGGHDMQIKKNPRESQSGEGRDLYEDDAESGLNAIPAFTDEPQRPAWRRESAFATTAVETRPPAVAETPAAPLPAAPTQASQKGESVVDAHSTFDGRYETDQDLRVLGTVSGEIICRGLLTVERDATAKAKIEANDVVARGRIEGEITCTGKLVIEAAAIVTGKIRAATLVVHEGAVLGGNVETTLEGAAPAPATRGARRDALTAVEGARADVSADARATRSRDLPSFALVSSDQRSTAERSPAPAR
jgi:cytoskeletal protein CcmA (bactofilin family)